MHGKCVVSEACVWLCPVATGYTQASRARGRTDGGRAAEAASEERLTDAGLSALSANGPALGIGSDQLWDNALACAMALTQLSRSLPWPGVYSANGA